MSMSEEHDVDGHIDLIQEMLRPNGPSYFVQYMSCRTGTYFVQYGI